MSGSDIPYHLRVNKFIERRIFVDGLVQIDRAVNLKDYAYISMGGAYLEDFRLLHHAFGITRLYSFDADDKVVERQIVNSPFSFIQCRCEKSGDVVKKIDDIVSELGASNVIVWLDFTEARTRRRQLSELQEVIKKLRTGDIAKVTLNASPGSLGDTKSYKAISDRWAANIEGKAAAERMPTFDEWQLEKFRDNVGEFYPDTAITSTTKLTQKTFAELLAASVHFAAVAAIKSRTATHRIELVSCVRYADGSPMLTVTLALVDREDAVFMSKSRLDAWKFYSKTWQDVHEINVPFLSVRERYRIHASMEKPIEESHASLKFFLDDDEVQSLAKLEQYRNHYLSYPSFMAVDL